MWCLNDFKPLSNASYNYSSNPDVILKQLAERFAARPLEGINGQQISSRQSFVGSLSSALSTVGGVRSLNAWKLDEV